MQKILLAGNAITAQILHSWLQHDSRYRIDGLVVDDEFAEQGSLQCGQTVCFSKVKKIFPPNTHRIVMASGYDSLNRVRESMFTRLKEMGYRIETWIHPDARIYTEHPIGEGSIILPSAIIEPHAHIGNNTIIWNGAIVAHHARIGDHCWLAAGTLSFRASKSTTK